MLYKFCSTFNSIPKVIQYEAKLSTGVDFMSCGMDHRVIQFLIYLNLATGNPPVVLTVYLVQ